MYDTDATRPDFSLPPLVPTDLSAPSLVMPDGLAPDPPLPDLRAYPVPDGIDLLPVQNPDPLVPDLTDNTSPNLVWPDGLHSPFDDEQGTIAIPLIDPPAELATSAMTILQDSPDAQALPEKLTYTTDFTTQDDMTHRSRHLAPLLLGLEGKMMEREQS